MGEGAALEFFGAFIFWMFTGFRGKMDDHYSRGSGSKQAVNFFVGYGSVIIVGITIAIIKAKISDP